MLLVVCTPDESYRLVPTRPDRMRIGVVHVIISPCANTSMLCVRCIGIPVAVRHIESIIRMSEAHAKMHLREYVSDDDVNVAIRVMVESFISTQKFSVKKALERQFSKYITFKKDTNELLYFTLNQLVNESIQYKHLRMQRAGVHDDTDVNEIHEPVEIALDDFIAKANELNISSVDTFLKSTLFRDNKFTYDAQQKLLIKQL